MRPRLSPSLLLVLQRRVDRVPQRSRCRIERNYVNGKLPIESAAHPVRNVGMNGIRSADQILDDRLVRRPGVRPSKLGEAQLGIRKKNCQLAENLLPVGSDPVAI